MAVYEFWDAEYLDMFQRAGIHRNTPPPFMPGCNLDDISANRNRTIIMSPIDGTRTVITSDKDYEDIAFRAISDMTNAKIFWFLDDKLIGTSISGETFRYPVPMGDHIVKTIDEMGAATSIKFSVIK